MNTAAQIAKILDKHLTKETTIVVYGAAALMLDHAYAPHMEQRRTNDMDIILPKHLEIQVDEDAEFWNAIENANKELQPKGLYITHIFPEAEVTLTPEWREHLVALELPYAQKLKILRPRVLDLIISKMGRADAADLKDIRQMHLAEWRVSGQKITVTEVESAMSRAHVPEAYREISQVAKTRILETLKKAELHAAEDKKRKEAVETKNHLDSTIYQLEKAIKDAGDKLPAEVKSKVEPALADAKKTLESDNTDTMKTALESLQKIGAEFHTQAQQAAQVAGAGAAGAGFPGTDPFSTAANAAGAPPPPASTAPPKPDVVDAISKS